MRILNTWQTGQSNNGGFENVWTPQAISAGLNGGMVAQTGNNPFVSPEMLALAQNRAFGGLGGLINKWQQSAQRAQMPMQQPAGIASGSPFTPNPPGNFITQLGQSPFRQQVPQANMTAQAQGIASGFNQQQMNAPMPVQGGFAGGFQPAMSQPVQQSMNGGMGGIAGGFRRFGGFRGLLG